MTVLDQLNIVLGAAGCEGDFLDAGLANRLAAGLGFDAMTADDFVRTLARIGTESDSPVQTAEFELRVAQWRLDLTRREIKEKVLHAIVGCALISRGFTEISVTLLAAVVPFICSIESVRLSEDDRRLLFEIRRLPEIIDTAARPDELYDRLPDEAKSRLNRRDFSDFIERLRNAGHAVGDDAGHRTRIRASSEKVPRISWSG